MKLVIFDLDGTLANIDHRLHFINQLAVLYMGLIYIWFYMAVTVSALGVLVFMASLFIDYVEAYLQ